MAIDIDHIERHCRVPPGGGFRLADHDPAGYGDAALARLAKARRRPALEKWLARSREQLALAQDLLWASDTHAVLLVFQAIDAAGKDGTIKHVMSGVNPQGCQVHCFKRPSDEDLDHNYLWRYWNRVPERGRIGIFNRSYYEEVLVVRVHPEILAAQKLPPGKRDAAFWHARYDDINAFERHLAGNGTLILKFFLNLSREEQRRRLLARIEDADKHWKVQAADLAERAHWDDYQRAYEDMLNATSTACAPWYVVPADHKAATRAIVAELVVRGIRRLGLEYPRVSKQAEAELRAAKRRLLAERR
jgi:PPK2 family polyphosphate:nucleotide phosphotransferase